VDPLELMGSVLGAAISMATPLLLAALGETLAERAGVLNVGLEGMMLAGALAGAAGAYAARSPWVGLGCGLVAGLLAAALFGALAVYRGVDPVVVGTGVNILCLGLTGVFFRALQTQLGGGALLAPTLPAMDVPLAASLPVVGEALFRRNALVYTAWALVPLLHLFLFRTRMGLCLRAVGEEPTAAAAAGIAVLRFRFGAVLASGALAGVAGVYLAIGHSNTFLEGMTDGRGFIALAVVIFGRWMPWGVLAAALVFGLAQGLQFAFQARRLPVPYQLFQALPYLVTLGALVLRTGGTQAPTALARPYRRD
jgi:simple sugar transport system permease protein